MYFKRIAIASFLALAIFGAVYGLAATISVSGVQRLGSGSSSVSAPPSVNKVEWILASGDPSKVSGVKVYFASDVSVGGSVYVIVDDASPPVAPYLATGSATFTAEDDITAGVTVTLSSQVSAADIGGILVTCVTEAY
jgi:FlaG/FlaF family flagellin (archaellin)